MAEFTREEILAKVAAGESLEGADLCEADLQKADLCLARYNEETKWPVGFDPVAAGALLVDG